MQITFNQKFKKVKSTIRIKNSLEFGDDAMVVWWYSGFYKNINAESQPLVLVHFRKYISPGVFGPIVHRTIPLTSLGQARIGTMWKHDRCRAEIDATPEKFIVNFDEGRWRFVSLDQARKERRAPPFSQADYPLQRENDANWMIELDLQDGRKLLVPCIEFFARCYGRSGELKRIVATYPWSGVADSAIRRLYAPLAEPEDPPNWKVRLRRRMLNGDVVFLAHAKYDPYTTKVTKRINAELQEKFDPKRWIPAFVKIAPWFEGPAELSVIGHSVDGGKSFLAQNIVGMSDPSGEQIYRGRENSNKADAPAPDGSPEAWAGAPEKLLNNGKIIDLTGDGEPDGDSPPVEVQDPDFVILGPQRPVIDIRAAQATTTAGKHGTGNDSSMFSAGEEYGSDKGIGYASIHAPQTYESNGILHDMWEAMGSLQRKRPDMIHSLSWFSFEGRFSSSPDYKLIPFIPFDSDENVPTRARRFAYVDPPKPDPRGFLVARLVLSDGPIYIIELQRRPKLVKAKDGEIKEGEDQFQGLVFRLDDDRMLEVWIRYFRTHVRYVYGVVRRLIEKCPGEADSFSHMTPTKLVEDCFPCEGTVLKAISKVKRKG
ncbi:hypothetical protein [Janthinobacterium sp. RT4P48]|uniref:hypothetical protein n=1 Tax=Janthinobacterium sp. RT4P48 TaxID=3424188 RepID=UPI003F29DF3D